MSIKMMSQSKIEAVIFDLDGTIVDTEETCAQVVVSSFLEWGQKISHDDAYSLVGRKFESALIYLMDKYKIDLEFEEALNLILTRYRQKITSNVAVVPGVVEAIHSLSHSYELGLVSGSHRVEIFTLLDQLQLTSHFKVIYGAEDYPLSKPEPDGYLKAMNTLAVHPQSVLIFEDSKAGLLSAKSAKAWATLVSHTQYSTKETHLADFVIPDFKSVDANWVNKLKLN